MTNDQTAMKNPWMFLATAISGVAIVLAVDPGRFAFSYVDAGGHALRMRIAGSGSPAVVFESGGTGAGGGPLEAWERVQPAVSRFTCTVAYDRAGSGHSDPGPKPRDARQIARELHTALHTARVSPPYMLVGHSFGGPLNRVFADMYPDEVAGLVLLDPTQEQFVAWEQAREHSERHDAEWQEVQATLEEAQQSSVPPGIPVVLVTAMGPRKLPSFLTEKEKEELRTLRPVWLKFHQDWLDRIPNGRHVITQNSGHGIPFEEPELVVRLIREVVENHHHGWKRSLGLVSGQKVASFDHEERTPVQFP